MGDEIIEECERLAARVLFFQPQDEHGLGVWLAAKLGLGYEQFGRNERSYFATLPCGQGRSAVPLLFRYCHGYRFGGSGPI